MTSNSVSVRHGRIFQSSNGSMEGGSVVTIGGADIIDTKNRNKQMELTSINERQEVKEEHARIDRHAGGRRSDKEWNFVRKDSIERNLGVENIEGSEVGRLGSTRSGEDGLHFRR